jgi:hypothetical protein
MRRSRKPVWAVSSIEGSNPSLSVSAPERALYRARAGGVQLPRSPASAEMTHADSPTASPRSDAAPHESPEPVARELSKSPEDRRKASRHVHGFDRGTDLRAIRRSRRVAPAHLCVRDRRDFPTTSPSPVSASCALTSCQLVVKCKTGAASSRPHAPLPARVRTRAPRVVKHAVGANTRAGHAPARRLHRWDRDTQRERGQTRSRSFHSDSGLLLAANRCQQRRPQVGCRLRRRARA